MKKNIALLISILFFSFCFGKKDTVSVGTAEMNKIIKLEILGKGGYQGDVISMKIKNLSPDTLIINVEAGRRLDSKDSTMQDILVIKDLVIMLVTKEEKTFDVTGYCCQAHNRSPATKSIFLVGNLAERKLFETARYISKAKLSTSSIQSAIWCMSDSNDLASVVDDGTEEVSKLKRILAKLNNIEVPWYSTFYKKIRNQLFSGIPSHVNGKIDYYINDLSSVQINIRDEKGTIVKSFAGGNSVTRGDHSFLMNWDVSTIPKGKYTIRIYQEGRLLKELFINLK